MNFAIISDIHSNCFALDAVLKDIKKHNVERLIILGDIFGYYPWAAETYQLLLPYLKDSFVIKGNHDQLLLDKIPPHPVPSYWLAAKQNEKYLLDTFPEALVWLSELSFSKKIKIENYDVEMYHGTPEKPESGRHYPTDTDIKRDRHSKENTIIFLGHTHYPLVEPQGENNYIVNPGSVGQPRDGNPMSSWMIWSTTENTFQINRSGYDNLMVMEKLKLMDWDERAIKALNKTNKGNLL